MIDGEQLKRDILSDMRVELSDEFDKNFERKAFFSEKWKQRANPNHKGSLLLVTGTMRRSIKAEVKGNGVRFSSAVPYAAIHNEGGTLNTHPSVTPKMRRFAWAKVYSVAGVRGKGGLPKELPPEAAKWRALALTKKSKLNVTAHIPRRQFMGESRELMQKVNEIINESINRIKNGIHSL